MPKKNILFLITLVFLLAGCGEQKPPCGVGKSPEEVYGKLFYDVQRNPYVFPDSKTFVDCIPKHPVRHILDAYEAAEDDSDSTLISFISDHFYVPQHNAGYQSDSVSVSEHITALWALLERPPDKQAAGSLIALPYLYVVPGGRFREVYYWDSYFTMLGLLADGRVATARSMIDNFAHLLGCYGFIPNGNRTYYLSRSQPPFFSLMVDLLTRQQGDDVLLNYLPALRQEYAFWMAGMEVLGGGTEAVNHVVRMPGGEILNRYWDRQDTPRPESYREDVQTMEAAVAANPSVTPGEVYRNIRSAAESGWDFSSRWLKAGPDSSFALHTIRTTEVVPVDLNALLYHLELMLARACRMERELDEADRYRAAAEKRKRALVQYCWDEQSGFFMDYDLRAGASTGLFSLAGVYPLFLKMATPAQAAKAANRIRHEFLKDGGLVTSLYHTGQQWDAPNGWAPLQWIAIEGLRHYGNNRLASEIRERWLALNNQVYLNTFKMVEKYNVEDLSVQAGGGEYPNQDGFGWTNGVFQHLYQEKTTQVKLQDAARQRRFEKNQ